MRGRFNYLLNIIFSLLNIKLNSVMKSPATTRFEMTDRTKARGVIENVIIADIASPLPISGIEYSPTAGLVKNIGNIPQRIIRNITGAIVEPASLTLLDSVDRTENTEIITSTTEIINARSIK